MAGAAVVMAGAAAPDGGARPSDDRRGTSPGCAARQVSPPFREVFTDQEAAPLVIASGLRALVRGLWTALVVIVALKLFGLGASGVGVLNGAAGVGA